jgi:hypothetical protein
MRFLVVLLFIGLAVCDKFVPCGPDDKGADNTYVVHFHYEQAPDTSSKEVVQAWADKIIGGGIVTHAYSFHEFRGFGATLSPRQLGLLLNLPEVLEVTENCIFRIPETQMEDRVYYHNSSLGAPIAGLPGWGQARSDQNTVSYTPISSWNFNPGLTGSGTTVWVLDTGCRCTHQQLSGRSRKFTVHSRPSQLMAMVMELTVPALWLACGKAPTALVMPSAPGFGALKF